MEKLSIGFIGGGRITRIFLQAFKNKSVTFDSIFVFDPNEETMENLQIDFPEIIKTDSVTCSVQDLVILAVHPPVMMETLSHIKGSIGRESVILSLAPKLNAGQIAEVLSTDKVIRMIPNATSFINKGFNPVFFNDSFSREERIDFMKLFRTLGETFEVEEYKLEGYALVSAMLPTYFWFQWEKLEEIGIKTGLSPDEARKALSKTLEFANDLFYRSDLNHDRVMDLIPVKPIGEHEMDIKNIYENKLLGLFDKIKSVSAASAF